MKNRTFLIGLDGATFTVLDPLMDQGHMPFLASFLKEGVRAGLRTIVPALTPPAWTSLMTGRRPGQHGVFDFFRAESLTTRHVRFFTSNDIGCDTVWSLASDAGRRFTALNFPSMFPPPRLQGVVVPGWVPWRQLRLACWPENLFDRLKEAPGFNPRELAMDIKLEERATEGCANQDDYLPWIDLHIRRERNWLEVLKYLIHNDPADLTAVLFDGVDKLQHLCWRFIRPEDDRPLENEWEQQVRARCIEYFQRLDGILEEICTEAGREATIVMASDHGFGPTSDVFFINAWLGRNGHLHWTETGQNQGNDSLLGVGKVARHTYLIDWSKTKAFTTTPTSNGIHIVVDRDGTGAGVPPAEYQAFREMLIEQLKGVVNPETGQPIISRICTREEVFSGPHMELAPDITIEMCDGGLVSILPSPIDVGKRPSLAGAHRPIGVFAARGPGIRSGADAGVLSILDVAPVLLHSMELPVPEEMEGRVPNELFCPDFIEARPVRRAIGKERTVAVSASAASTMRPEDEQIVLERLRELGYIE